MGAAAARDHGKMTGDMDRPALAPATAPAARTIASPPSAGPAVPFASAPRGAPSVVTPRPYAQGPATAVLTPTAPGSPGPFTRTSTRTPPSPGTHPAAGLPPGAAGGHRRAKAAPSATAVLDRPDGATSVFFRPEGPTSVLDRPDRPTSVLDRATGATSVLDRPAAAGAGRDPAAGHGARDPGDARTTGAGRRHSGLPFRRVVQGVLIGAVTMFAVATLDMFAGANVPVLSTFAALPSGGQDSSAVVEVPTPPSQAGTCLTWIRVDAADAAAVDCAQPHLFEEAGSVELSDQPTLPGDGQWRQLVAQRCDKLVSTYLGGRFDPDGRFRIGALKPSPAKWVEGDRELRCGLQSASQSGALYPMIGKVAGSDQSDVEPAGTCLGISGKQIGDPVPCAGQHAVETVGIVDLSVKFTGPFPAVADQDAFLQPTCAQIAGGYAGGPAVISGKKLTIYWDNLTPESWRAGSRKVNCNLGALLPDRSGFAPVTGSVKGAVAVGSQPAPPATATPPPGVPALSPTASAQPSASPAPPTTGSTTTGQAAAPTDGGDHASRPTTTPPSPSPPVASSGLPSSTPSVSPPASGADPVPGT